MIFLTVFVKNIECVDFPWCSSFSAMLLRQCLLIRIKVDWTIATTKKFEYYTQLEGLFQTVDQSNNYLPSSAAFPFIL